MGTSRKQAPRPAPAPEEPNARDAFVIEKFKRGFGPTEILVLLDRNGFKRIARSNIYNILERHGIAAK